MEIRAQLPLARRAVRGAKSAALSGMIRPSSHLSDETVLRNVRRLAGTNQFHDRQHRDAEQLSSIEMVKHAV